MPDRNSSPPKANSAKILLVIGAGFGGLFIMCCGGCAIISVIGQREMQVVRQEMADADTLWKAGKKQEAVAKYRPRLDSSLIDDQTRPIAFGRTIDLAFETGDVLEGQRVIELASSRRVTPSVNCPEAKVALAVFEEDRRRAEAEKKQTEEVQKKQATRKKGKYTRSEFKSAVVGLTKDDLIDLIGRPARTQELSDFAEYWYYTGRTTDPASGKTDNGAQVVITNGHVTDVNFY